MIFFFSIFFTIYGALNYYIFIRGWQAFSSLPYLKPFYIIIFLTASLSYILARFLSSVLPPLLYNIILWIGSFWFAFMLYFILFLVLIDIIRLSNSIFNFFPLFITHDYNLTKQITLLCVVILSSLIIPGGYLNTRKIVVNNVTMKLPKKSSRINELNVVLVSDFHLTPVNDGKLLSKIVDRINSLQPDIVLMPGDIVDDKINILKERNIGTGLAKIKSSLGVYASNGNHEIISGVEEADKFLKENGIKVLRDSAELINGSFYLIGREDRSISNFTNKKRKPLTEIIKDVNENLPVIILDHTPSGLDEVVNKADLQLSGHTHHGQMFPLNLITNLVYEVSWGYLVKGNTQFYVTCGVGTWGPPVRLGSSSEIVNLKIRFVDK
jgi:predicted MPP superfamily phosphohydrolase